MRFVIHDTVTTQKQILKSPVETQGDAMIKQLLLPFKDIEVTIQPYLFQPGEFVEECLGAIGALEESRAMITCREALEQSYRYFWEAKFLLELKEVHFGLFLSHPGNKRLELYHGYHGLEILPGYIGVFIWPTDYSIARLKLAVAHEFNHQMRLAQEPWLKDPNLGEYLILKGLADSFSERYFGKELSPLWVQDYNPRELERAKNIIKEALQLKGFDSMEKYMLGDKFTTGDYPAPLGLPNAAGYAVGYQTVQSFMKETGKSIIEATMTPTSEILANQSFL